ncbi:MAG: HAD family hydrolase, partial [Myxococcota bacterium]|nr:HAD family hydrolase [Myxococcota bacterium]
MTLVLFDIDGTLIRSHGAGRGAMTLAGEDSFGHPNLFDGISFAGGVDTVLVRQALSAAGLEPSDTHVERLRRAYARRLPRALAKGHGVRCPGVETVLSRLEGRVWS